MNSSQTQIALLNDLIVNAIKTSVASCLSVNQCKVCNEESDGQTYGIQACKDCDVIIFIYPHILSYAYMYS